MNPSGSISTVESRELRRIEALRHTAFRNVHQGIDDLIQSSLDLAAQHHLEHEVQFRLDLQMEIRLAGILRRVEMQRYPEMERRIMVLQFDQGIRDPGTDFHSDMESLDRGLDRVEIRRHALPLVFRKHVEKIAHVREGHVQFVRRS